MVNHYRHLRSEDALRRMERINFLPTEGERRSGDAVNKQVLNNLGVDSEPKQEAGTPDTTYGAASQTIHHVARTLPAEESCGL